MRLVQRLFFDPEPPTEEQLSRGRRCWLPKAQWLVCCTASEPATF